MNVALFKETYVSPRPSTLSTVIELMKVESKSKTVISCRHDLQNCVPGEKLSESKLPPMVLFNHKQYNGLILLEVNNLADSSEVNRIRQKASESPQTLTAFTGLSGRSVKILIRFSLPDGRLPQEKEETERFHAHAYRQAVNYYRMQLKKEISLKPPLPGRGCRLSFDPDLYFNPDALVITLPQPLQMPDNETWEEIKMQKADPLERLMPGMERNRRISLLYETSLKETLTFFGGFPQEDPKLFLIRLAENCCHSGIPEEDAVKWTAFHSELSNYEMEFRTTIHNVYALNKKIGQKPCLNASQQLALQLEEFMQRRYEFRRNDIKKEVEYRERGSYHFDFMPVTDEALNTFSLQAHAEGLNFWDRDIKRYVHSNRVPTHNPIDYYLDHLPVWNGVDHIRALAKTIPTDNTDWPDLFYRWFLGLVAQWKQMSKTHANSVVPLLVGKQGCGKSTWCRNLIPHELRDYYTDGLDLGSKRETEMALHRFALINLDEFDSISLNHQPFLKHLLQKPEINARRPYKSSIRSLKRYGVFIATCNNLDLLTDPTGSRRFLCVEITGQIDENQMIDISQVYAQALAVLQNGERYWFDKEDEAQIIENNSVFQQISPEEQLLLHYFTPVEEFEEDGEWMLAIEIVLRLQKLGKIKFSQAHVRHFGRILMKNHIPVKRTNRGNMYHLKQAI